MKAKDYLYGVLTLVFVATLLVAAYLGFALVSFGYDKALHFLVFGILTAEFYFLFEIRKPWKLTLVVMTFGASISLEFLQNLVNPKRIFDYEDILYNIMGSAIALVICVVQRSIPTSRRFTDLELGEEDSIYVNLQETSPSDN